MTDKGREEFEHRFAGADFTPHANLGYLNDTTQWMWLSWQAASKELEAERNLKNLYHGELLQTAEMRTAIGKELELLRADLASEQRWASQYKQELELAIQQRDFFKDAKRQAEANESDARNSLEAVTQKIAEYDRWLSGGVYFTTDEYKIEVAEKEALESKLAEATHLKNLYRGELIRRQGDRFAEESSSKELEAAKQRNAELQADVDGDDDRFLGYEAQVLGLEKKLAGLQAELLRHKESWHCCLIQNDGAEELTKLLAAAEQRGADKVTTRPWRFDLTRVDAAIAAEASAKQAGRDELQKEQIPVAEVIEFLGDSMFTVRIDRPTNIGELLYAEIPLPLPPTVKEK